LFIFTEKSKKLKKGIKIKKLSREEKLKPATHQKIQPIPTSSLFHLKKKSIKKLNREEKFKLIFSLSIPPRHLSLSHTPHHRPLSLPPLHCASLFLPSTIGPTTTPPSSSSSLSIKRLVSIPKESSCISLPCTCS